MTTPSPTSGLLSPPAPQGAEIPQGLHHLQHLAFRTGKAVTPAPQITATRGRAESHDASSSLPASLRAEFLSHIQGPRWSPWRDRFCSPWAGLRPQSWPGCLWAPQFVLLLLQGSKGVLNRGTAGGIQEQDPPHTGVPGRFIKGGNNERVGQRETWGLRTRTRDTRHLFPDTAEHTPCLPGPCFSLQGRGLLGSWGTGVLLACAQGWGRSRATPPWLGRASSSLGGELGSYGEGGRTQAETGELVDPTLRQALASLKAGGPCTGQAEAAVWEAHPDPLRPASVTCVLGPVPRSPLGPGSPLVP